MTHKWWMHWRACRIRQRGIGPFTPAMCNAFVYGFCQRCGKPLPENALLGNALVIVPGQVQALCSRCRTGTDYMLYPEHPFRASPHCSEANNTVDRRVLLGELDRVVKTGYLRFSYLDLVLCLREGYGQFQRYGRKPFGGFSSDVVTSARAHFGRLLPGSCSECGALWASEWEMLRPDARKVLDERGYSDEYCWTCHFPHDQQWFMRTTYEEEAHLLLSDGWPS